MPKKKPITVALTCVGSMMSVEMIKALTSYSKLPIRVVGVDMDPRAVGQYYTDVFYSVPSGNDPSYPEKMLEICQKEDVKVVIPGSDEEAFSLANTTKKFKDNGVVCTVPRKELVKLMSNKFLMYEYLKKKGVPVPQYYRITSHDELSHAADMLGYPDRPFVIKPASSRGGRGIWKITKNGIFSADRPLKSLRTISLKAFLGELSNIEKASDFLAMEYLGGPCFDVDVLSRKEKPLYVVPRRRINPLGIPFFGNIIEKNTEVLKLARKVQSALSLSYLHDLDIFLSEDNVPFVSEVNPRMSGSVTATVTAGINLLEFLVRVALNLKVPQIRIPYGSVIIPSLQLTEV